MLFPARFWPGLADGTITTAYRRQKRPTVKAGGTLRSPGGMLQIDAVEAIKLSDITEADALAAGHTDLADLHKALRPEGTLYRFRFHRAEVDPRDVLRATDQLSDDDLVSLRRRLDRMPWAESVLRVIKTKPSVVSTELAADVGMERFDFKAKVTKLKALGLTVSESPGYHLSPRGEAVLLELFGKQ